MKMIFGLFILLCSAQQLYAQDGICKCIFVVGKEGTEQQQFSSTSQRPVICDSCELRCNNYMNDRLKVDQGTDAVRLERFECQ